MELKEQLEHINKIRVSLETSVKDLQDLKYDLVIGERAPKSLESLSLDDIISAVERRKKGYGNRLKFILKENGVNNINDFLNLTILDLYKIKNIGGTTLKYVLEAASKLGINYYPVIIN